MEFEVTRTSCFLNECPLPLSSKFYGKLHYKEDHFIIEIDSLTDLIRLQDEQGNIIIRNGYNNPLCIEIYDDYRE